MFHLIKDCQPEPWNNLVEHTPTGSITQTWEWGTLQHLQPGLRLAVADDTGAYVAAALMFEEHLMRQRMLYVPRGPVCVDPTSPALAMLVAGMRDLARERHCFAVRIEPHVLEGDEQWLTALRSLAFHDNPYAIFPRRSWILDISQPTATILSQMKKHHRYNIKVAQKEVVTVRHANTPEDQMKFYQLYQDTAKRQGFFIHPFTHYAGILDAFQPQGKATLLLAEFEGQVLASAIIIICGTTATYLFGASSSEPEHRRLMPTYIQQWTAIQWAQEKGCTVYDFRSIAEVIEKEEELYNLYLFKRGFGGTSELCIESQDLVVNPIVYNGYRWGLQLKRNYHRYRHMQQHASKVQATAGTKDE